MADHEADIERLNDMEWEDAEADYLEQTPIRRPANTPEEVTVRLTREEAKVAADWIRGHRPRSYPEDMVWGRVLDRAVNKLRTALALDLSQRTRGGEHMETEQPQPDQGQEAPAEETTPQDPGTEPETTTPEGE